MIAREFFKKYDGQCLDFDGQFGNQCMDVFNYYRTEVLDGAGIWGAAYAWQLWDLASDEWEKIENTPDAVPHEGDVVIWNKNVGDGAGHVAIATGKGDINFFESFDQNWPLKSCCHFQEHNYLNVIGWLRCKLINTMNVKVQEYLRDRHKQKVFAFGEALEVPAGAKIKDINYESVLPTWLINDINKFKKDIIDLKKEKEKLNYSLSLKSVDLKLAEQEFKDLQASIKSRDSEIKSLQEQIDALKKAQSGEESNQPEIQSLKQWWEKLWDIIKKLRH